jgi:nitrogen-specific signal transduction histidine kinase
MKTTKMEDNAAQPWNMAMNPEIWRYIFDAIEEPAFLHDAQFRVVLANRAYCREAGKLEIRAVENKQGGAITVSVRDSGIGMAPEVLTKLFQPLFTTKARGIGLGLMVVKNLTQVNGGRVEVQSEPDRGTMFTVTLPMETAAERVKQND